MGLNLKPRPAPKLNAPHLDASRPAAAPKRVTPAGRKARKQKK